ncbi:MAG TPA: phosphatase PAP2 family protein [Dongiaceae bacterium]|nr:phosphatase PAP2 family protein [Dongiaceae bacterium]
MDITRRRDGARTSSVSTDGAKKAFIGIIFWLTAVIFLALAGMILVKKQFGFDAAILLGLHAQSTAFLDKFFVTVTNIGGITSVAVVSALILAYFVIRKQWYRAQIIFFGMGGAAAANVVLKHIFQRDRPSLWHQIVTETGYSFPSGHAMMSAALFTCLLIIFWSTKWRWVVITLGAIAVLLIGTSRLYLGVHFPTDILGGWCVSVAWVLFVRYALGWWHTRRTTKEA